MHAAGPLAGMILKVLDGNILMTCEYEQEKYTLHDIVDLLNNINNHGTSNIGSLLPCLSRLSGGIRIP